MLHTYHTANLIDIQKKNIYLFHMLRMRAKCNNQCILLFMLCTCILPVKKNDEDDRYTVGKKVLCFIFIYKIV